MSDKEAEKDMQEILEEGAPKEVTANDLKRVQTVAKQVLDKAAEVEKAETKLKELNAELTKLKNVELPQLMRDELQLESITLKSGEVVTIKPDISASITVENKPKAHAWLEKNGHGSLIKHEMKAALPREMSVVADSALRLLDLVFGIKATQKEAVNFQTLKAFVKEQLGKGATLPDCITVHEYFVADIKKPKK